MAIPNEKLQQLLQEIESKAQFSSQQLVLVRQQLASQTRKKRMLELSTAEIDATVLSVKPNTLVLGLKTLR